MFLQIRVYRRKPSIMVKFEHSDVGLLLESFPLKVLVENNDDNDVYLVLEVSVKSSFPEIGIFLLNT